jgi:hypothetical protein
VTHPFRSLIIAGLTGGGVAAILTALITTSHERQERMRNRKIEAADQLCTAVIEAFVPFRILLTTRTRTENNSSETVDQEAVSNASPQALDEMRNCFDFAVGHQARVDLLFGASSKVGKAADQMMDAFVKAMKEFESQPSDTANANVLVDAVADGLDTFTDSVHSHVETLRWRFWNRVRRRA